MRTDGRPQVGLGGAAAVRVRVAGAKVALLIHLLSEEITHECADHPRKSKEKRRHVGVAA